MIEYKKVPESDKELAHIKVFFDKEYVGYIIKGDVFAIHDSFFVSKIDYLFNFGDKLKEIYKYLELAYTQKHDGWNIHDPYNIVHVIYDGKYYGYLSPEEQLLDDRYISLHVLHASVLRGATNPSQSLLINKRYIDEIKPASEKDILDFRCLVPKHFKEDINVNRFNHYFESRSLKV